MTWKRKTPSLGQRLFVGLVIVVAASLFRLIFFSGLGRGIPYLIYYPATMLAALYGGLATGFLVTALSSLVAFFWVQQGTLSPPEWLGFLVFILSCMAISIVCEWLRRTRKKIERVNQDLQTEVIEHKQAAEALSASELRYRRLFEAAKDGILILDAETGMIVDVNPFLLNLLGITRDVFLGKKVWELGFFKDLIANEAHFTELQQKKYIRYENMALEGSDGRRHEVEFVSNVYLVNNHKVIQCNIRDISERKRAEAMRMDEAARRRILFEECRDGIVVMDRDGKVCDSNRRYAEMLGYSRDEMLQLHIWDWDTQWTQEQLLGMLRSTDAAGIFIETRHRRKDGSTYDVELNSNMVRIGGQDRIFCVCRDITERKRVEAEKENLQKQLIQAQKMESIGRLAGGVAHDFNNMLMTILGNAELCKMKLEPGHPVHKWLDAINKGATHAKNLTNQLLAFARLQPIQPKVLDLNATVSDMLKWLQRLIGEHIVVKWQPGTNLWPVEMDLTQINQILTNLIVNARDAIQGAGSITLSTANAVLDKSYCVRHSDVTSGNYVALSVSDTGCGMDPKTLAHVFEPFFTTKAVGKGTGLGLATVYGIVKQNNGTVDIYSEPGRGTRFNIYLPRALSSSAYPERSSDPGPAVVGGSETILLVEDQEYVRDILYDILVTLGYTVLMAESSEKALRLVAEHPGEIHLLVTDVIMPDMNGWELSQRLSELRPSMKHLFMSGFAATVLTQQGILDKGAYFLSKPFSRTDLARKVREALTRSVTISA